MAIKPMPGISPVFVTGLQPESIASLPEVRRLTDGEDFSAMLHDLVVAGYDRFRGMTERDAVPAMLAFLRGAIAAYGWHGAWIRLDGALTPVADSSEPLLPLDVFCKDGTMHVGDPRTIAEFRRASGERTVNVITCRLLDAAHKLVRTTTLCTDTVPDVITWRGRTFVRDMTTDAGVEYVESPAHHMADNHGW